LFSRRSLLQFSAGTALSQGRGIDLSDLPNFCSHEHWGSIASIGSTPEGYRADVERGALPTRRTGILDLLVDPYSRGFYARAGSDLEKLDFSKRQVSSPWDTFQTLQPILGRQRYTGTFQTTRRGILQLYGVDISRLDKQSFQALDDAIALKYANHFDWYRDAMNRSRFSGLIRPVHPEFYVRQSNPEAGARETAFTKTVLRIDPFVTLWNLESPRRKSLSAIASIEPVDARSWRHFLDKMFELAAAGGALGIKQLQAYRRPLEFGVHEDSAVRWVGNLDADQQRIFEDWVVHECCKRANDRGWPHQVHVGTNNIEQSSPMGLYRLGQRYPQMKIVMIHCWPFLKEAGWIAKFLPNAYIDSCWLPILNPEFFREAISIWWNYVPLHKITCGQDATTVEMAAGSSLFHREILGEVLTAKSKEFGMSETEIREAAQSMLNDNAIGLYGLR